LVLLCVGYAAVEATIFMSVGAFGEGGTIPAGIPIIATATGCLMKMHRMNILYTYEQVERGVVTAAEVATDIDASGGVVVLRGHGSPDTIDGCGTGTPVDYAAFLKRFQNHLAAKTEGLKHVISYGCETGQNFVAGLKAALAAAGYKKFTVSGPGQIMIVNCGASPDIAQAHFGRILKDAKEDGQALAHASANWAAAKAAGLRGLSHQEAVTLAAHCAKAVHDNSVMAVGQAAIALANAFTPTWQAFIQASDLQHALQPIGQGWVSTQQAFMFRQLMKKARVQRQQRALSPSPDPARVDAEDTEAERATND